MFIKMTSLTVSFRLGPSKLLLTHQYKF